MWDVNLWSKIVSIISLDWTYAAYLELINFFLFVKSVVDRVVNFCLFVFSVNFPLNTRGNSTFAGEISKNYELIIRDFEFNMFASQQL